ncbi:putative ATPase [Aminobacter aminovorans]|jgi:predicted ATPase|uniref:Arginine transporter ATP-binding subunit n=1 Tax=Aminobacter aminovorans TaxID=83263 RepID=A0A380WFV0_AMIAI|nr:AAA family ATPase [Aminobacter aminovorans]TCS27042.1 putative ATPase [Aminobacter aminovorans]SUU87899.1 arginine transporter ATP-binding subunit [Aminobacter aminovorans]
MRLTSFSAAGYRSLRSIRLDIGQVSVFVGENGVGKSNLYRALQLIKASAEGTLAREIAAEGGMSSALWSGKRRTGQPARVIIDADFTDDETSARYSYKVEIGLPPPVAAGFAFEPHVKEETLTVEAGRRPVEMMTRKGQAVFGRDGDGRRVEHPERILNSETALALLGGAGRYPEVGDLRAAVAGWRFYHGFRTDADSLVRRPALATTAPMLDEDGANLAAVFATLRHIREDTVDLDRCIADALGEAQLDVPVPGESATFGLVLPEFPQRVFRPQELSDGQIRFLALAGALMSYRLPRLIALNEPEASLHVRMLPALADMIARAAERTQVWVVTHSRELADLVHERTGSRALTVIRVEGATMIEGMRSTGLMPGDD